MSDYRINFNGQQISREFTSYAEVEREITEIHRISPGHMWIQRYEGDGEWSGAGLSKEKRQPHLFTK